MSTAQPSKQSKNTTKSSVNQKSKRTFASRFPKIHIGFAYTLISAFIIIGGTFIAIGYAKGNYRLTREGVLRESGLLNANSFPSGAEVFINGRLVTATDDTLYLEPGQYDVEIVKDGFWPWKKNLTVERELVTQTNALLFPTTPSFTPLTFSGVDFVIPSPDGQKLLFLSSTATTPTRNGLYILELTENLLSLQRGPRQISELPTTFDLTTASFIWSPSSNEIMILSDQKEALITIDRKHSLDTVADISFTRKKILSEWEEEMYLRERQFLAEFPEEIISIATQSAQNVYISPDKKRLFYTATQPVTIPTDLVPPIPATNTQPETRTLEAGSIYVYDREEDKNFFIDQEQSNLLDPKKLLATDLSVRTPLTVQASPSAFVRLQESASTSAELAQNFNKYHTAVFLNTFQWFPDSKHLLYTLDSSVEVRGYDNTNRTTVYSGPFDKDFVYPWPDGSRLLILTAFNSDLPMNLYAIDLKQ